MTEPTPDSQPENTAIAQPVNNKKYARLKEEVAAPYRGLRQFVYVACGASGFIGAFVFLAQLAAGNDVGSALPNFALQLGVVALMVWLFRLEQRAKRKSKTKKG